MADSPLRSPPTLTALKRGSDLITRAVLSLGMFRIPDDELWDMKGTMYITRSGSPEWRNREPGGS